MYLVRVFQSAFVRKIAYILAMGLMGLILGHHSWAANPQCRFFQGLNPPGYDSASVAGNSFATRDNSVSDCATTTNIVCNSNYTATNCADGGTTWACDETHTVRQSDAYPSSTFCASHASICGPQTRTGGYSGDVLTKDCVTNACAGKPNMDILTAIQGNTGTTSGTMCVGGCQYTNSAAALTIGGPRATVYGQAVSSNQACGGTDAAGTSGNCASGGGVTTCVDPTTGKGTVNGDTIDKASIAPVGDCVVFASGGSMCTYSATKPLTAGKAPTADGTTPDTPAAVVTDPASASADHTIKEAVFTAAQNAASVSPTSGTKAASTGTGTGTSGAGNAANGDCAGSGVNCPGDGTVPSLARSDTIESNVETYISAIKSAPIIAGITSISSSFPTASAPTVMFTLWGHNFDAFAPFASIWGGTVAPTLSLVFLAMWAVAGARVILTA